MEILNTYHVPFPVRANANGSGFLAVLTQGAANDRAVYVGICGDMNIDKPGYDSVRANAANWIAHSGLKLSYDKALAYFPQLTREQYRD